MAANPPTQQPQPQGQQPQRAYSPQGQNRFGMFGNFDPSKFDFSQFMGFRPQGQGGYSPQGQGGFQGFSPQQGQGQLQGQDFNTAGGFSRPQQPMQGQQPAQGQGFNEQFGMKHGQFKNQFGGTAFNAAQDFIQGGAQQMSGPISAEELKQGGYTGAAGRVAFDPVTGRPVPKDSRKSAELYAAGTMAQGPALQEASNFEFDGLPESNVNDIMSRLLGSSSMNNPFMQQGGQSIQDSIGSLMGVQTQQFGAGLDADQAREQQLQELQSLQQQALAPNLDPESRALLMQQADERRAEVGNIQNDLTTQFNKGVASDAASLAARGVLDSTTAGNVLGAREANLGIAQNQLMQQANEQSRQDLLGERNTQRETALGFGGIQGQQALGSGNLLAELLGQQAQTAQAGGSLGAQLGGLGNQASQLDQQGLGLAGQLGLQGRQQEADLQLAELGQRLMGDQTQLNNLLGIDAQSFNQLMANKSFDLNKLLAEISGQGMFSWDRLFG